MPYYTANYVRPEYKSREKLYALKKLHDSGFLSHLLSLPHAKAIILFGSFMHSDWYSKSDIDLFILGNASGLRIVPYEMKLKRDIQVFHCPTPKENNQWNSVYKLSYDALHQLAEAYLFIDKIKGDNHQCLF